MVTGTAITLLVEMVTTVGDSVTKMVGAESGPADCPSGMPTAIGCALEAEVVSWVSMEHRCDIPGPMARDTIKIRWHEENHLYGLRG